MIDSTVAPDDLGLFGETAAEYDLPWDPATRVARRWVQSAAGHVSALRWASEPQWALVHEPGASAHVWDAAVLAGGRSAAAFDLPGHGFSSWWPSGRYQPVPIAGGLADAVASLAPKAELVAAHGSAAALVAMLAARQPRLVRAVTFVDGTPGTKAPPAPVGGPYSVRDDGLADLRRVRPRWPASALRRAVLQGTVLGEDGRWIWRHDPRAVAIAAPDEAWAALDRLDAPVLLVRGDHSDVVGDDAVEELRSHRPDAEVVVLAGAGHDVHVEAPVALAAILAAFADRVHRVAVGVAQ